MIRKLKRCNAMSFSLRLKFGCLILLVICWCLFMAYLVTSLEFQWMPPLPLLQSLQRSAVGPKSTKNFISTESLPSNSRTWSGLTSVDVSHPGSSTQKSLANASAASSTVQIVTASDGRNLGGLIAAINSILSNTKHTVKFYIVITEEDHSHLKTWIQSSKLHTLIYKTYSLTSTGNQVLRDLQQVKVNFGLLFPKLEGKVIYIDCDVIVKGDIWDLYSTPIQPNTYGAFAPDCSSSSSRMAGAIGRPRYATHVNMKNSRIIRLKINGGLCPFSVGVFVANVSEWRKNGVFDQLQMWQEIHSVEPITGVHPSVNEFEAAMLLQFYKKVTPLDPLWHVQHLGMGLRSQYSKQFIEHAKLLHWNGHFKPWRHMAAHTEQWDYYFVPDPTLQFRPIRRRG